MNIFEWLFERQNPGPIGSVEQHNHYKTSDPTPVAVISLFLIALICLGIPFYLADFPSDLEPRWTIYLGILIGEIFYLIFGYFFNAQPHKSNVGGLVA